MAWIIDDYRDTSYRTCNICGEFEGECEHTQQYCTNCGSELEPGEVCDCEEPEEYTLIDLEEDVLPF